MTSLDPNASRLSAATPLDLTSHLDAPMVSFARHFCKRRRLVSFVETVAACRNE